MVKDNFSAQSVQYAKYRPAYPPGLFRFLTELCVSRVNAWDCGTGTGLVAEALAPWFKTVYGTDISANQLKNALKAENIVYLQEPAEATSFQPEFFDLITVAQAIHWFRFDKFYDEVRRVIKPGGIFAVIGYGLFTAGRVSDEIINRFYEGVLGEYWDPERKYIDEGYRTIPFPFDEIKTPEFFIEVVWTLDELSGFLDTWSAVQHFIRKENRNPVKVVKEELGRLSVWKNGATQKLRFPVLLRLARIEK